MKKYWLVLSPNTFMWLKGEGGLLYYAVVLRMVTPARC